MIHIYNNLYQFIKYPINLIINNVELIIVIIFPIFLYFFYFYKNIIILNIKNKTRNKLYKI